MFLTHPETKTEQRNSICIKFSNTTKTNAKQILTDR